MPIPRYERELEARAGPRFRRIFLMAVGAAALLGLLIGLIWVIAGLMQFQILR
jgi:hypothetical protein